MKYTINRTKRNILILCSSFLILYVFIVRLFFLFTSPTKIDIIHQVIQNVIFLIPFAILMLAFFDYFRHYKLKVLQISILTVLIMEVIFKSTLFSNIFESTWIKAVFLTTSAIWILATIILIVSLSQNKMKDYPGILSIRNYSICIILNYILATTIPHLAKPANYLTTLHLVELTSAIPYIFTIVFALKLYGKE